MRSPIFSQLMNKTSANANKVEFVEVNNDESNKALKDIETDKTSTNVNKVESKGE